MAEDIPAPPAGFILSSSRGPFSTHNGPYFHKVETDTTEQAFFALKRHANGLGIVHGGMLTAFLDGTMGSAVYRATRQTGVTINLTVNFLHMGRVGDWVMSEAKVTRFTKEVAFVEGRVYVGATDVVRGSGVFKLMHRRD